jgi:general secretion pathway protein G
MIRSQPLAEFSVFSFQCLVGSRVRVAPAFRSRWAKRCYARRCAAVTLIELLAVVAIIAILAGLSLATMGYVNRKSAESRTRSEVAALSSAIENFKLEQGRYPAAETLLDDLTGAGGGKVYFEVRGGQTNSAGNLVDPYGDEYQYSTNSSINNRGFFDIYSKGGQGNDESKWIRNW